MTAIDVIRTSLYSARATWGRALRPEGAPEGPIPEMPRAQLVWRPVPGSHSIGRLLWHIAETDDRFLREFILQESFEPRFGKTAFADGDDDSIPAWNDLMSYLEETRARTLEALPGLADRLDEPRDFFGRSMTIGQLLVLMATHEAAHAGQIAHIAGVIRRAGW